MVLVCLSDSNAEDAYLLEAKLVINTLGEKIRDGRTICPNILQHKKGICDSY